jgi:hypothetical protein
MPETNAQASSDVAMKGDGYYSLATRGAADVIDGATTLVLKALQAMPLADQSGPFTMTDMGCADGGTSLGMVRQALAYLREQAPQRPLTMSYSDQPRNDYNALFRIIHGLTGFNSYLNDFERVYVMASATSFYRQIVADATLNLGFSATAMHWLSRKPGNISNHVHMVGAAGDELAVFADQGRRDWQTILLHRAAELAPGGRLVLVNFGRDEVGRYLGNTGGVNMFDTFNHIWQQLLDEGIIRRDEYIDMTLPQYYNTVAEFSAPLTNPASPVYQAGLRLEHIETRVVRCPFAAEFEQHRDAQEFAREYIPTLRSWTESTFMGALSPDRTLAERQTIIDRFYDTYEALVRDHPEGHGMDYVHAYLLIARQ